MGNKQTTTEGGSQDHERLGLVKVTEAEDTQTHEIFSTMELTRPVESDKQVEAWLKEISKIDDSETREVLLLPLKHEFEKQGMCGSTGVVHLTYENYSFILENEIKNRLGLNKYFLETEMWYLLYNMIRAGNKFERVKSKVGDVHPSNILINDDGQVKLISTCSLPNEQANFDKIVETKEANVFLAPEELEQNGIAKGEYPINVDPCKAEVFSIGLTLLSSGTLENCNNVYEKSNGLKINHERIQKLINQLSERYSVLLTQTIAGMLNHNLHQRRRCSEVYQMLFPYENEILELEPFSLPTKVSNVPQSPSYQQPIQYGHQSYAPTSNINPNANMGSGYRPASTAYSGTYQQQQPMGVSSQNYQTGGQAYLSQGHNQRF